MSSGVNVNGIPERVALARAIDNIRPMRTLSLLVSFRPGPTDLEGTVKRTSELEEPARLLD
jgi:hypothetical protein